jgi:hypothetical protein
MENETPAPDTRAATSDLVTLAALAVAVALAVSVLLAAGALLLAGAVPEGQGVKSDFTLRPPAPG